MDAREAARIRHARNGNDGDPVWSYDDRNTGFQFRWWGGEYTQVYRPGEIIPFSVVHMGDEDEWRRLREDEDAFVDECKDSMDRLEEEAAQMPHYG